MSIWEPKNTSTDVTAIKAVTDLLPNAGALTSLAQDGTVAKAAALTTVDGKVDKIDGAASLGMLGVSNSVAYRVHEIERHFHGYGKWFGAAAAPSGEMHVADRMGPSIAGFSLVSGNNAFGNWVQILGSSDTPVKSGMAYFDLHKVLVTNANDTAPFLVQIASGESAALAATIAAETFTEFPYEAATNQINSGSFDVLDRRFAAGTKMWARCISIGANAKTIIIYVGIHEYEG